MTNKIIGIQGDKLDKINISSDTSIFLAHEAQKFGYKILQLYKTEKTIYEYLKDVNVDG